MSTTEEFTKESVRCIFDAIKTDESDDDVISFIRNRHLFHYAIESGAVSFKEIVDKHESVREYRNEYGQHGFGLLFDDDLMPLIDKNIITREDLRYLFDKIEDYDDFFYFHESRKLLNYIFDNSIASFTELIDIASRVSDPGNTQGLHYLLNYYSLGFYNECFIGKNQKSKENCEYLLNSLDNEWIVEELCEKEHTSLLKYCFENYLIDKETVDRFNEMFKSSYMIESRKFGFFNCIRYHNKDIEFLKLVDEYEKIYVLNNFDFTKEEKLEIAKILENNDSSQKILNQIVNNNLEDQYSFDSLKSLLNKEKEKKKGRFNL